MVRSQYFRIGILWMFTGNGRAILIGVLLAANSFGQSNSAVNGRVTDQHQLAIPNAHVVVTAEATNQRYETTTNGDGLFNVPSIATSIVRVSAEADGFKRAVSAPLMLDIGASARVDLTLTPADSKQTIEISAEAPALDLTSGMVGTTISSAEIQSTPMQSRNILELALTIPGVGGEFGEDEGGIFQSVPTAGAGLSVSGGRAGSSAFLADGANATSIGIGRSTVTFSPDTVQEFKVITSTFSAQYGVSGGGMIMSITKSGTNEIRGSTYWYHRNPAFEARQFNRAIEPQNRRNELGLTLGGPVILPKIYNGKQKTFFFFSVEPKRFYDAIDIYQRFPTAEERQGDFRNSYVAPGQTRPLIYQQVQCAPAPANCNHLTPMHRPTTTSEFPLWSVTDPDRSKRGFVIPKAYLDKNAQLVLQDVPLPNQPFDSQGRNYFGTRGVQGSDNRWNLKIDQHISAQNRFTFRYSEIPNFADRYRVQKNNLYLGYPSDRSFTRQLVISDSHIISPRIVNEFRGSYTFSDYSRLAPGALATTNYTTDKFGLPNQTGWGYPWFQSGFGSFGLDPGSAVGQYIEQQFQYADDVTMTLGRHTITAGVDFRFQQLNVKASGLNDACCGNYNWDPAQTNSGNANTPGGTGGVKFASFLLGVPNSVALRGVILPYYYRWKVGAAFVQDDFKFRPNVTLNLGLRWQYNSPRAEKYNRQATVDLEHPVPIDNPDGTVQAYTVNYRYSGFGGSPYLEPEHKANFEPRFGFAWVPKFDWNHSNKVVIRGGYGISHTAQTGRGRNPVPDFGAGNSGTWGYTRWTGNGKPALTQAADPNYLIGIGRNAPVVKVNPSILDIPSDGVLCAGCTPKDPRVPGGNLIVFSQSNQAPYVQTWNMTVQAQVTGNLVLSATYLGQKGTHLYSPLIGVNTPDPIQLGDLLDEGGDPNELVPDPFGRLDKAGNLINTTRLNLMRPFPTLGDIDVAGLTSSNSIYHGGTLSLDKRFHAGYAFRVNYSWSKSIDNSSDGNLGGAGGFAWGDTREQNAQDLKANRSVSLFDGRHRLNFTMNAELPFGKRRRFLSHASKPVNFLVRDWSVNALGSIASGLPFAPYLGDANGVPNGASGTQRIRPDIVPGVPLLNPRWSKNVANDVPYFNPEAFARPAYGQLGNAPRTLDWARNPWRQTLNGSVFRDFRVFEDRRRYFQFRAEAFNVLNHATFITNPGNNNSPNLFSSNPPVSRTGLSLAGPIPYLVNLNGRNFPTGTRENLLAANYNQNFGKLWKDNNGPGRIIQLALKIYW